MADEAPAVGSSSRSPDTRPPTANDFDLRLGAPTPLPPGRAPCSKCSKNRQWYCPECLCPVMDAAAPPLPQIWLPLKLHVLHGREEKAVTSKATGIHAAIVAPQDVTIYHLPDFPSYADPSRTLLLFPSPTSKLISELPDLSRYDTLLVVDTTWQKVGGVMQLPQLALPFQHVAISSYSSLFWRYQPVGPQCVSTIEAVYYFMREWYVETSRRSALAAHQASTARAPSPSSSSSSSSCSGSGGSGGTATRLNPQQLAAVPVCDPQNVLYDGRLDPLLLLFMETYRLIQRDYTQGKHQGKDFTARHRPGYIRQEEGEDGGSAASAPEARAAEDDESAPGWEPGLAAHSEGSREQPPGSAGSSATAFGAAQAPPEPKRARIPDRLRGAWAIRTDLMDPEARQWTERRMERFVANNSRGDQQAAAAAAAAAGGNAATANDADDDGAAAAGSLRDADLAAAAFRRVQELQRQEYAVARGHPRAHQMSTDSHPNATTGVAKALHEHLHNS